jgi:hypothetical protein
MSVDTQRLLNELRIIRRAANGRDPDIVRICEKAITDAGHELETLFPAPVIEEALTKRYALLSLHYALSLASKKGVLDDLNGDVHPDHINAVCDAVASQAENGMAPNIPTDTAVRMVLHDFGIVSVLASISRVLEQEGG